MKQINISHDECALINKIFEGYTQVFIFGSRVKQTNRRFSDLDVCIKDAISDYEFELLKEKLENSDLPFKVDLIEYKRVDDDFKSIIDNEGVLLKNICCK